MNYISHEDGVRAKSFKSIVYSWIFFLVVTVFGCVIFMAESNAFIFERFDIMNGKLMANPDSNIDASLPLSRSDDTCAPLLQDANYSAAIPAKSIKKAQILSGSDITARRKAGQAIALALMAGMTIAVEPSEDISGDNKESSDISSRPLQLNNTLHVVAYRQCKRQAALKELEAMRWSR